MPAPPMVDFSLDECISGHRTSRSWEPHQDVADEELSCPEHSEARRARITSEMMNDDCDRERVEIAEKRRRALKDEPAGRTREKKLREPETEGVEDDESSSSSKSSSSGSSSDDMEDQTDETDKEKRKCQVVDDGGEEHRKRLKRSAKSKHDDMNIGTVVFDDGYLQTACQEEEEISMSFGAGSRLTKKRCMLVILFPGNPSP